jgi:hypothetical protein
MAGRQSFSALGLKMIHQFTDKDDLDTRPDVAVHSGGGIAAVDQVDRLLHAPLVTLDALATDARRACPVGVLEALLALAAVLPEQRVVAVEPVEDRLRYAGPGFHALGGRLPAGLMV